jgi:hypothetical protein
MKAFPEEYMGLEMGKVGGAVWNYTPAKHRNAPNPIPLKG